MNKLLLYAGIGLAIFGAILLGAGFFYQMQMEQATQEFDDKCGGDSHADVNGFDCMETSLRVTQYGLYFLSLSCGGGIVLIIGTVIAVAGFLIRDKRPQQQFYQQPYYGYSQAPPQHQQYHAPVEYEPPPPGAPPPP